MACLPVVVGSNAVCQFVAKAVVSQGTALGACADGFSTENLVDTMGSST